ncbi:MAG TPA: hypothetical protein PKA53_10880 [Sphingobacterium sp.]|nr:hypothetical protein [Sphingobacterium sp.]
MLNFQTYYHIYNHANGTDNLFRSDENYRYFLQQWSRYIKPVAFTYAYCLMPNHFHFLIRTKSEAEIRDNLNFKEKDLPGLILLFLFSKAKLRASPFENLAGLISKQFGNLFNSYAKAYNKQYNRKGSLFMKPFKSKQIPTEIDLITIVNYIHRNPIHHGFCENHEDWLHSSYHTYLSERPTKTRKDDVLDWFNGKDEFINFHKENMMLIDKS